MIPSIAGYMVARLIIATMDLCKDTSNTTNASRTFAFILCLAGTIVVLFGLVAHSTSTFAGTRRASP